MSSMIKFYKVYIIACIYAIINIILQIGVDLIISKFIEVVILFFFFFISFWSSNAIKIKIVFELIYMYIYFQ
jgi:hypothetical protein